MARFYKLCCSYRLLWRRRLLGYLLLVTVALMICLFLVPRDSKKYVDVYVIEEHHEALIYWHHLTVINKMNRTRNTLIHIDAHSDMGSPTYLPEMPLFEWPLHEPHLFTLLQRNDVFIQGAAMIGMLDHIIWIYPSWDKNTEFEEYTVFLFEIGIFKPKSATDKHLIFCECHTPVDKHTHKVADESKIECSYLDETKPVSEMEVKIEREQCNIRKSLLFEVIVDGLALEVFQKGAWLEKPNNVILDIDEDYFGCERGGMPLEQVKIPWSTVEHLNSLINDLICAKNPIHEETGDKLLKDLIAGYVHACQLTTDKTCNMSSEIIVDKIKLPVMKQFHMTPRLFCHSQIVIVKILKGIVDVFKGLSHIQLASLADLGFCMNTSPVTLGFDEGMAEFRICHGANTPNETIVTIYTPTEDDISRRMLELQSILKYITDLKPNIVTLCRSIRDGYTPRHFVKQIEDGIVNFFTQSHEAIQYQMIYDDNLLGGKEGWHARYKVHL